MLPVHQVTIEELTDVDRLEREWVDLFARSNASVFLSWHWIGSWLQARAPGVTLLKVTARRAGQVVGLAVVVRQTVRRHGLLVSDLLALHEYAVAGWDFMTEHNGLLVDERWAAEIATDVARALVEDVPGWDELQLSGLAASSPLLEARLLGGIGLGCFRSGESDAWYVDLDRARAAAEGYLATLSKKTRYKLRGYCRDWERFGELRVDGAATLDEALAYFAELKGLHQAYWKGRGKSGSFANSQWEQFHRRVIESAFGVGGAQLLRVMAGSEVVGYVYSLVQGGQVYMIQSGYNYAKAEHAHPGFVSLYMAVKHNVRVGKRRFDFLAGDAQYKRMLGHGSEKLVWVRLRKPRVKFRIEDLGRTAMRKLRGLSDDVGF